MNLLPTISITRFVVNLSQAFYAVRLFLEKNITSCATFIAFFALSVPVLSFFSWAVDVAVFSACSSGESFFLELVLPVVACVCAVLVSSVSNPMHALLSLLGVFFTTTLILLSLGINYLGYGFLIIYVGAIAILFLFVIMLFNVKVLTVSSNLVQYLSQVIVLATCGAAFLHPQNNFAVTLHRAVGRRLSGEAALEPTTGEAIFLYVRRSAMDIYSIIPLYTAHGILFLIITSILLSALLGAVILATSTTERGVEISDIRAFSVKRVSIPAVTLAPFALTLLPFVEIFATYVDELPLVFITMSTFFYDWEPRKDEDQYDRLNRSIDIFCPATRRSYKYRMRKRTFFVKKAPLLSPSHVFTIKKSRRQFFVDHLSILVAPSRKLLRNRKVTTRLRNKLLTFTYNRAQFDRRVRNTAIAPVALRWRFPPSHRTAMLRSRWLWRWRRGRATSLRRIQYVTWRKDDIHLQDTLLERIGNVVIPFVSIPEDRLEEFFNHDLKMARIEAEEDEEWLAKHMPDACSYGTLAFLKSPLGWRRLFPGYIWSVYLLPSIMFSAWRIRAFCVYFFCFMLVTPLFLTSIMFFEEDYYLLWQYLWETHAATADYLHQFTELRHVDITYSKALSLLLLPVTVLLFTANQFYWTVLFLSVTLAMDGVLAHGGELSDSAFQESRSRWWHLNQRRILGRRRAKQNAILLARSKRHPDKGRFDTTPWFALLTVKETFVDFVRGTIDTVGWFVNHIENFYNSAPIRCIRAMINRLCADAYNSSGGRAVRSVFVEIYTRVYSPIVTWLRATGHELWTHFLYYLDIVWNYAWQFFYSIEYTPRFLSGLTSIHYKYYIFDAYSAIFVFVFAITMVYFLTTFVVLLGWRRTYYHAAIRRPSAILYTLLLIGLLYVFAVLYRYTHSILRFDPYSFPYYQINLQKLYEWYLEGNRMGYLKIKRHLFGDAMYFKYVWWEVFWIFVGYVYFNWIESVMIYINEPVRFRLFVNGWARHMFRYRLFLSKPVLEKELAVSPSTEKTIKQLSTKAREWRAKRKQARWLRTRTMKWIHRTYIPYYYDPYPDQKYRVYSLGNAYVAAQHHKNSYYSVKYSDA
jgi:NADH:ubiquinone oxidoreductase subunit 6 (subunit J)